MTARHEPERTSHGAEDRAESAGTNTGQGAPRPDTKLSAGSSGAGAAGRSLPDPDYGIDPALPNPMYGGTGRGSGDMVAQASNHAAALEGADRPDAGADSTTGGMARGGDTTSTADTFSDEQRGLGESGVRGHMDTGVNTPGAAGRHAASRSDMADPNDESTFQEGTQHVRGSRA
jgi:hypothetical protein